MKVREFTDFLYTHQREMQDIINGEPDIDKENALRQMLGLRSHEQMHDDVEALFAKSRAFLNAHPEIEDETVIDDMNFLTCLQLMLTKVHQAIEAGMAGPIVPDMLRVLCWVIIAKYLEGEKLKEMFGDA